MAMCQRAAARRARKCKKSGTRNHRFARRHRLGGDRLGPPQELDRKACRLERRRVALERAVPAVERHPQAVALERVGVRELVEIRARYDERALCLFVRETARRVDGMNDGRGEHAVGLEHACALAHGAIEIVDVGDERQRFCGSLEIRAFGTHLTRSAHQRRRRLDPGDSMPARFQIARHAPFPAAEIQRRPAGRGKRSGRTHRDETANTNHARAHAPNGSNPLRASPRHRAAHSRSATSRFRMRDPAAQRTNGYRLFKAG
jgi:hypothetical protein